MIGYGQFLLTYIGSTFVPLFFGVFFSVIFTLVTENNSYLIRFLFFSFLFGLIYFHIKCATMGAKALKDERRRKEK